MQKNAHQGWANWGKTQYEAMTETNFEAVGHDLTGREHRIQLMPYLGKMVAPEGFEPATNGL